MAALLTQFQLPFLVLKGLPLAQQLYGDIALRPSSDIDVLIKPGDFQQTHEILLSQGFQVIRPTNCINRHFFLWQKDMTYTHPDHPFKIDLHWRLDRNPSWNQIDFTTLWQQHETVTISGINIPVLGKHDNLLYLCQHGAKHGWSNLKWLQDIVDFCQAYTLDWPALWQQANSKRVTRPLLQAVMLIEKLYDKPLPFTTKLSTKEHKILQKLVSHAYQYLSLKNAFVGTHAHRIKYHWQLCHYWRYKLDSYRVICWRHATWWQEKRLPAWAFGLVYVLEPLILRPLHESTNSEFLC